MPTCCHTDSTDVIENDFIDIRHHFIREAVERGDIKVEYLPTDQMPADVLTKGLSSPKQNKCIHALGMTTTT
jgi:hypothetical protein